MRQQGYYLLLKRDDPQREAYDRAVADGRLACRIAYYEPSLDGDYGDKAIHLWWRAKSIMRFVFNWAGAPPPDCTEPPWPPGHCGRSGG